MICPVHGPQTRTRVCSHIIQTLEDQKPRGFWWATADGELQAVCTDCENMPAERWAQEVDGLVSDLCVGCFRHAAKINGVGIPKVLH